MAVRVEVESEIGISRAPAKVRVYVDDRLMYEVIAKLERKQGADGDWYPCINLEMREK